MDGWIDVIEGTFLSLSLSVKYLYNIFCKHSSSSSSSFKKNSSSFQLLFCCCLAQKIYIYSLCLIKILNKKLLKDCVVLLLFGQEKSTSSSSKNADG